MASLAALRAGAGLVTAAVPQSILPSVAAITPELMTLPLEEDANGDIAGSNLDAVSAAPAHRARHRDRRWSRHGHRTGSVRARADRKNHAAPGHRRGRAQHPGASIPTRSTAVAARSC